MHTTPPCLDRSMDLEQQQYWVGVVVQLDLARLDYALPRAERASRLWYKNLKLLLAFSLVVRTSKIVSTVASKGPALKSSPRELYDASCTKTGCRSSHLRGSILGAKEIWVRR